MKRVPKARAEQVGTWRHPDDIQDIQRTVRVSIGENYPYLCE